MKHDQLKLWTRDELEKLELLRKNYPKKFNKGTTSMWRAIGAHFSVTDDSARNAYTRHMRNKNRVYINKNKYREKTVDVVKPRPCDSKETHTMLPLWEPFLEYRGCSDLCAVHEAVQNSIKEWIDNEL